MSRLNEHETDWNDPGFDALLDDALSIRSLSQDERAAAALATDGVLAATAHHFSLPADAVLDPLLDEALAATGAGAACPVDLADRIVRKTLPELPEPMLVMRVRKETEWRRWAIAAAVAIASSAFWFTLGSRIEEHQETVKMAAIAEHVDEAAAQAIDLIAYRSEQPHPVDHEIVQARRTAQRLQGSLAAGSDWQDAWVALDQAMRDEFDPGL